MPQFGSGGARRYALVSVFDKSGIVEFCRELLALGYDILASAGTAVALRAAGIVCTDIAVVVGDPILGHRVVTLSRQVAAGLLARDTPEDAAELARHTIPWIELVCVDLYPLGNVVKSPRASEEDVMEATDIGGPTLLREGAKGRRVVVARARDRSWVLDWLRKGKPDQARVLRRLAGIAETEAARYAGVSAEYLTQGGTLVLVGERAYECKYGENPYQRGAAYFSFGSADPLAFDRFEPKGGTEASFNLIADVGDRLLQTLTHVRAGFIANHCGLPHITVAAKHGEPCGAAYGDSEDVSLRGAIAGSLEAVHGGTLIMTYPVDGALARTMLRCDVDAGAPNRLLDCVVAPSFDDDAIAELRRKGENKCRLFANPALATLSLRSLDMARRLRYVRGGVLVQPNFDRVIHLDDAAMYRGGERQVTAYDDAVARDLLLGAAVCATTKSNTITLVKGGKIIANAYSQSRVRSVRIALMNAASDGHDVRGAVAVSDSFFPFTDAPKLLLDDGVAHILTCSGALRDGEVVALTRDYPHATLSMVRNEDYRMFFGH